MNLVNDPWIPVRRGDGPITMATLTEVTRGGCHGPHWGRPEMDVATIETLVGMAAVAWAPTSLDGVAAARRADDPSEAVGRLARHAAAFDFDGRPGLLQDQAELTEPWVSVRDALFLDSGASFTKLAAVRGPFVLSRAAAAAALLAVQSFSTAGGRGHRTGLRGGGPLTCVVVPQTDDGNEPDLWDVVMANLTPVRDDRFEPADPRVFPWMAPTLASGDTDTAAHVHEADPRVHPLQAYWGMPRRLNLRFAPNHDGTACAITGIVDDVVAVEARVRHGGVNYGNWRHPMTAYREITKKKSTSLVSLKPSEARQNLTDRAGLLVGSRRGRLVPALAVSDAIRRASGSNAPPPRILVAGFVADKAKIVAYRREVVPIAVARDDDALETARAGIDDMAAAASAASEALRFSVGASVYPDWFCPDQNKQRRVRAALLPQSAAADLHVLVEPEFDRRLDLALRTGVDPLAAGPDGRDWRQVVTMAAREVLGRHVPSSTLVGAPETMVARVVAARRSLESSLAGWGAKGEEFFTALGLEPPKRAARRKAKGQEAA